jgi:hypothetical protein
MARITTFIFTISITLLLVILNFSFTLQNQMNYSKEKIPAKRIWANVITESKADVAFMNSWGTISCIRFGVLYAVGPEII